MLSMGDARQCGGFVKGVLQFFNLCLNVCRCLREQREQQTPHAMLVAASTTLPEGKRQSVAGWQSYITSANILVSNGVI